ncbi:MAG: DUF1552 domain-containing protein [Planctomycetia bacterium]|nr:DUF1552 domain-containing protein [Planctomycetia bacterium]
MNHAPRPPRGISRRALLRGAGVAVSLPWLETFAARGAAREDDAPPRRLLAIETTMGLLPHCFFPRAAGPDYEPSPYLARLAAFRDRFTVFSGLAHPLVDGGHAADICFLTGAPHPASGSFRNTISLDQVAAEALGGRTRFASLPLTVAAHGTASLSFTRSGAPLPGERSPAALYRRMFLQGDARETAERIAELGTGRSVLDFVGFSARRLDRSLTAADRARLERYFTAVREVEQQMQKAETWERRRRPKPKLPPPPEQPEQEFFTLLTLMGQMARLAFETDSTRVVTMFVNPAVWVPRAPGVAHETHALTHHGNRPEMIEELQTLEAAQFSALAELLGGLAEVREGGGTLLDHTMVLFGSCLGNANSHSNTNLPILLAGGGFRHAGHLAFDPANHPPLANLYVSMLQRLGLETDRFASSTGTLRGLEPAS